MFRFQRTPRRAAGFQSRIPRRQVTSPFTRFAIAGITLFALAEARAAGVTDLHATYRAGQIFLTWDEPDLPEGTTLTVYVDQEPITTTRLPLARRLAHSVRPNSARDWWQDTDCCYPDPGPTPEPGRTPNEPVGFVVAAGASPLDPTGGLFVHTVTTTTAGPRYFAVTTVSPDGTEERKLAQGQNALAHPIDGEVALPLPIWVDPNQPEPPRAAAAGKRLVILLHGRGGAHASLGKPERHSALAFGDARQGWREGLAYKFRVQIDSEQVTLRPYDLAWTGRPVKESIDSFYRARAVVTWWYGYSSKIHRSLSGRDDGPTVAPNYTEERLLWLVRWAQEHLGTDPTQTYLRGGSMGGSGAVSMALHHPEIFAAVRASVPIVSYTKKAAPGTRGSIWRLECILGPIDETAVNHDGVPILQHMNGTHLVETATTDLPPLFITNGRRDGSIPWVNNPPFYRAMNAKRQALSVFWTNGGHSFRAQIPPDVGAWDEKLYRYRLDQSYIAFSGSSDNRNPGSGDATDGDLVGWFHRGLDWKDVVDTEDEYRVTVLAAHADLKQAVEVDITPRRRQSFRPQAGTTLRVKVDGRAVGKIRVDEQGLITIRKVRIPRDGEARLQLKR